ncbi:hypothetical protein AVEN_156447-1 [Araneus ventricosus]|uniref:Uncharacterized protein n=1 Tax=Araneus ventricosus TaxID=182803 RepID=A0A4Y2K1W5_ARAVE|nr:hypothetical protein AVEN_156447-1 [Araneus ventricosus]
MFVLPPENPTPSSLWRSFPGQIMRATTELAPPSFQELHTTQWNAVTQSIQLYVHWAHKTRRISWNQFSDLESLAPKPETLT